MTTISVEDNLAQDPSRRAPLVVGCEDFASVTEKVCRIAEQPGVPRAWAVAFAVFGFNVAIIDVPDPLEQGPAYMLFTREFYRLLKSRLTPQGLMVAQSGPTGPAFYEQCFSAVANTVASVFPSMFACEAFVPAFGTR